MSAATSHKSHTTGWIISVVLALVLYVGSAYPVLDSFYSRKGSWLPRSWEGPVRVFYQPAWWLWYHPPLKKIRDSWADFLNRILDVSVAE